MKVSFGEIVDRYTIEILKETNGTMDVEFVTLMYRVNKEMWELEEVISKTEDLAEVGRVYRQLRELTKKRAELKGERKTY